MQITTEFKHGLLEMRVLGRLDNESSAHLSLAIDDAIREGSHAVGLDLSQLSYMSSAGISVLIRSQKQFQTIHGHFGVIAVSPAVGEIIRLTGLSQLLLRDREALQQSSTNKFNTIQPEYRVRPVAGLLFEVYDLRADATLSLSMIGDPSSLQTGSYVASQCRRVEFPATTFGLGEGAFGDDFQDCQPRFGEFLAVAGAAAQLPTEAPAKPDYQLGTGDFVPAVQTLYGLTCTGDFSQQYRFEPGASSDPVTLSTLVEQCLTLSKTPFAGMVMIAETSGLIGTALRRSPALVEAGATSRFSHPEIRRWMSFSPDRAHPHSLAIITGVAVRRNVLANHPRLNEFLRPLTPAGDLYGHFHAAVFSYRPFKKRRLPLAETVATLFETEDLRGVLHLLNDDRPITGAGESTFVRGACWISPVSKLDTV